MTALAPAPDWLPSYTPDLDRIPSEILRRAGFTERLSSCSRFGLERIDWSASPVTEIVATLDHIEARVRR